MAASCVGRSLRREPRLAARSGGTGSRPASRNTGASPAAIPIVQTPPSAPAPPRGEVPGRGREKEWEGKGVRWAAAKDGSVGRIICILSRCLWVARYVTAQGAAVLELYRIIYGGMCGALHLGAGSSLPFTFPCELSIHCPATELGVGSLWTDFLSPIKSGLLLEEKDLIFPKMQSAAFSAARL